MTISSVLTEAINILKKPHTFYSIIEDVSYSLLNYLQNRREGWYS